MAVGPWTHLPRQKEALGATDHSSQASTLYRKQEGTRDGVTEQSELLDRECPTTPEAHAVWEAVSLKASEDLWLLVKASGHQELSRGPKKTPHLSPASVFCSPLRRRVKNGTTQQPFNMSHLDNSLPCQRACPFHSDSRKKSKNRFRTKETPTCLLPLYFF